VLSTVPIAEKSTNIDKSDVLKAQQAIAKSFLSISAKSSEVEASIPEEVNKYN
jgi:hypothetical protein